MRTRIIQIVVLFAVLSTALFVYFQFRDLGAFQRAEIPTETAAPSPQSSERAFAASPVLPQQIYTLEITVLEAGSPVSGAQVLASLKATPSPELRPSWTDRKEMRTDVHGHARLQVQPGLWFVVVQKEGFADAFQDVVVEADTAVTLSLERGFDVFGIAVDTEGHALAPAQIKAIPLGEQLTKRTSAPDGDKSVAVETNGAFKLSRLSRGWWRLEGESEGFGRSEPRVISVPTAESVSLVFRPSGFIEGVVVNKDGKPAAHATVSVVGENETTSVDSSETGAFSVERQPGAYRLSARLQKLVGSTTAPTFVRARGTVSTRITLEGEGATLRGHVLRDDGAPIADATILVSHNLEASLVAEGRSDKNGFWELTGLPPGTVDIEASFAGMSPAQEIGFHLVDGANVEVKLTLARLGLVEGTVVDADGKGVAAQVVLRGKYEQFPERQMLANANGQFQFSNVPSGDVVVQARVGAEDSGATAAARAEAGATTKVSLVLPARHELRVEINRTACKAIEAVSLKAFEPDAPRPTLEMLVPESAQHVVLKLRPGSWELSAASGTPKSCAGVANVLVTADTSSHSTSIRLVPAPPKFQVTVLESTKEPAPGAQVTVVSKDGSQLRAETDLDGRAMLAAERGTIASVSARKQGRSARVTGAIAADGVSLTLSPATHLKVHIVGHQTLTRLSVIESSGEFLPVEAASTEPDVFLAEVPEGALEVRASNADDTQSGDSNVTARAGETAEVTVTLKGIGFLVGSVHLPASAQGQARVAVTSGFGTMIEPLKSDGRFRLGPMPGDEYTVEVRCTGCTWPAKSVQVGSNQETRVEFQ